WRYIKIDCPGFADCSRTKCTSPSVCQVAPSGCDQPSGQAGSFVAVEKSLLETSEAAGWDAAAWEAAGCVAAGVSAFAQSPGAATNASSKTMHAKKRLKQTPPEGEAIL